jgi:hypothetical protein
VTEERRQFLAALIDDVRTKWERWLDQPTASLVPDHPLHRALTLLAEQAEMVVPERAEPIERLIEQFAEVWREFLRDQDLLGDPSLLPPPELWHALGRVVEHQTQAQLPALKSVEPIEELLRQNVPRYQICLIYGFLDEYGNPDYVKLAEEISRPGTHTGPGWIAPVNRHILDLRRKMTESASQLKAKAERLAQPRPPELVAMTEADDVESEPDATAAAQEDVPSAAEAQAGRKRRR